MMKKVLALMLALCCLTGTALAAEDYTVAEKLVKQLWAGSGFSGVVTVEIDAMRPGGLSTEKPIVLDVDAIYVRPTESETDEYRADIQWMDGETVKTAAHAQWKDEALSFQADVLGEEWYTLDERAQSAPLADAAEARLQEGLQKTGVPEIARAALSLGSALQGNELLAEAIEPYKTRIDIWIEAYRQDAILGKLADGTTTMEVNYAVAPAAVKAQIKQLVLDMLSDNILRALITDALGEDAARIYVNPVLQDWYFGLIDALPIEGDLTISRMVSLKGDTLKLDLSLPMYDPQAGNVTLAYNRTKGEGDLPDDNVIRMDSDLRSITLSYQEYSSMTGVKVLQGTLQMLAAEGEQPLAAAFTLKQEETLTRDSEDREVYGFNLTLSVAPDENAENALAFGETEIALTSTFASKELKSAATSMEAKLVVSDENAIVTITLEGASRKKWDPEAVPAQRVNFNAMPEADYAKLLAASGVRALALSQGFIDLPAETPAATEAPTVTE